MDPRREVPAGPPKQAGGRRAGDAAEPEGSTATFTARPARRSMADLVVPAAVLARLELAQLQVTHHKTLYDVWNLRKIDPNRTGTALNFYGAPGTGKSLAAEAIAHGNNRPVIDVDYAEIESKYVGDTPKNIVACFQAAAESGAVLVFNEADSLLGARLSNVTQSSDHSVNVSRAVMLSQLDGFAGLVVFTTNFPRNYDAAFVRRILLHVRFDLPDEPTRTRLWDQLVPAEVPGRAGLDTGKLAASSEGLAGGDIVAVVKNACARAVARTGGERALTLDDLLPEIEAVRQAKDEVGRSVAEPRVVSVERMDGLPGEPGGAPAGS
jgi:SpoVK/Ycf46/Vps4 family AAA+-type ATPase